MRNKLYIVTAYRWGDRSMHSYNIGAFTDKDKAIESAISHCEWRGGKYACVVEECEANRFDNEVDEYTEKVFRAKSLRD